MSSEKKAKMIIESTSISTYMGNIGRYDRVSIEEEKELAVQVAQGSPEAFNKLITANLRLVVRIAHDYKRRGRLEDLVSAGNMGLITAVRKFDPDKGAKFSTYAGWWIKQNIRDFLVRDNVVRIPVNMVTKLRRIRETTEQLAQELGRTPTDIEVAEKVGVSRTIVKKAKGQGNQTFSLDAPISDDSDATCLDRVIAEDELPLDKIVSVEFHAHLKKLVNKLDKRSKYIIVHRFGLKGCIPKTLEEISAKLGCTRERVRQVQNNTLRGLKRSLRKME